MTRTFNNDLKFGLEKEETVRQNLITYFKEDIIKTKNKYCKYDYECLLSNNKYEVKSRRNNKHQYPTTIIPVHKVITKDDLYFVFNFIDQCCYIKYDDEIFKKFKTKLIKINRLGKYDPPTLHYEIPINLLIDIN